MKIQIIILTFLLALSTVSFAQKAEDASIPITCDMTSAKPMVKAMADVENKGTFSESLRSAGSKLILEFANLINWESKSAKTDFYKVQYLILKAVCIKTTAEDIVLSEAFKAKHKKHIEIIKGRAKLNIDNLPKMIEGDQINTADANNLMYHNADAIGFVFALFGD